MAFIEIDSLPVQERRPGWIGRCFHSPSMTFVHWSFRKGADIHAHSHPQEEVWHVLEGELAVTVAGQTQVARPGVVAVIPPQTPHAVVALSDGRAMVVDYPLRPEMTAQN